MITTWERASFSLAAAWNLPALISHNQPPTTQKRINGRSSLLHLSYSVCCNQPSNPIMVTLCSRNLAWNQPLLFHPYGSCIYSMLVPNFQLKRRNRFVWLFRNLVADGLYGLPAFGVWCTFDIINLVIAPTVEKETVQRDVYQRYSFLHPWLNFLTNFCEISFRDPAK